ncbi:MAG TPA: anhydro-N-acetylmuramic acid kinase, partial [Thermopetrobacter sp.]|nr:anhydro-N-acetylmuramic acid kinase [Thermopetrobacter sp.]
AIRSDGVAEVEPLAARHVPWDAEMRSLMRAAETAAARLEGRADRPGVLAAAERALTEAHVEALASFLAETGVRPEIVGFHGQTVLHAPARRLTVQLGDGQALADALGVPVAWDMRAADVAAGGQGAPLVPAYHAALAARLGSRPAVFVNIGGIANVTWVGADGALLAFDCGPGNAPIDDWMRRHGGHAHDAGGATAARGRVRPEIVEAALAHDFFRRAPPKSLDRAAIAGFVTGLADGLETADGAATLTMITARGIAAAAQWFPSPAAVWVVCGGGRHNRTLMAFLRESVPSGEVLTAEEAGFDGDMIEAQCWAHLAVRALRGLPLSWPETTGVPRPLPGGVISRPGGTDVREEGR